MAESGKKIGDTIIAEYHHLRDKKGLSQREAAYRLGISTSTASKYDRFPRSTSSRDEDVVVKMEKDPVKEAIERADKSRKIREEAKAVKDLAGELSFRNFVRSILQEAILTLPAPKKHEPFNAIVPSVTTETLLLILSDWHAYETVRAERVLGLNEFNAEVLGRRTWTIKEKTLSIKSRLERGGWNFPEIVVVLAGDFISGSIHDSERHSDAPNVAQAAVGCSRVLAEMLRDVSAEFDKTHVVGVPGNHGRFGDARRMQQKDPTRNWDWLIYQMAQMQLANATSISWHLPDAYSALFSVCGHKFLVNHGHDIKSNFSIPFYGMGRMTRNIRDALHEHPERPDCFIFGHFHEPGSIENYIVNGALIGPQEFSLNCMGKATKPYQWLIGIHQEQGISHQWKLHAGKGDRGKGYECRPWLTSG